jgi:hypothetical protein
MKVLANRDSWIQKSLAVDRRFLESFSQLDVEEAQAPPGHQLVYECLLRFKLLSA